MQNQYHINNEYVIPRAKNDSVREALENEFIPSEPSDITYYRVNLVLDTTNNQIFDFDSSKYAKIPLDDKCERFLFPYQMIPSGLALYRLICTFGYNKLKPSHVDGYKCVWAFELQHQATGIKLCVGEHKGGFNVSVACSNSSPDFLLKAKEVGIRFLSLLTDQNFTHPYDRVIAGSVA